MTASTNNTSIIRKVEFAVGESKSQLKREMTAVHKTKEKLRYKPAPPKRQMTGSLFGIETIKARKQRMAKAKARPQRQGTKSLIGIKSVKARTKQIKRATCRKNKNLLQEHSSLKLCKGKVDESFDNLNKNLNMHNNEENRLNDVLSTPKVSTPKSIHFEQEDSSEIRELVAKSRKIREAESEPYVPDVGSLEKLDSGLIKRIIAKNNEITEDLCMIMEEMKKEEEFTLQKNITQGEVTINYGAQQVLQDGVLIVSTGPGKRNIISKADFSDVIRAAKNAVITPENSQLSEATSWVSLDSEISLDQMERHNDFVKDCVEGLKVNLNKLPLRRN